ncbi:unnamed protein product [Closterium sp. NIES-54]
MERSRVVQIAGPERNYHYFYQLCEEALPEVSHRLPLLLRSLPKLLKSLPLLSAACSDLACALNLPNPILPSLQHPSLSHSSLPHPSLPYPLRLYPSLPFNLNSPSSARAAALSSALPAAPHSLTLQMCRIPLCISPTDLPLSCAVLAGGGAAKAAPTWRSTSTTSTIVAATPPWSLLSLILPTSLFSI